MIIDPSNSISPSHNLDQRFLVMARKSFALIQECTNRLGEEFSSNKKPLVAKIFGDGMDSERIGILTVTDFEPNTITYNDLPSTHKLRDPGYANHLLTFTPGDKMRAIALALRQNCSCKMKGYISLDRHFTGHRKPVQVPVELLFVAIPPEYSRGKTTKLDCLITSGDFPSQLITANNNFINMAEIDRPLDFELTQIDIESLQKELNGMQTSSWKYVTWSFLQGDSGLKGHPKRKPLAIRVFSESCDLGNISVESVLKPNYHLGDADILKISSRSESLINSGQNYEEGEAIRKTLRKTIPREHLHTHLICSATYGPDAPITLRGKTEGLTVLMNGGLNTLNVGYDLASDCTLLSGDSLPENLTGLKVNLVTSNHINVALDRLQENKFNAICGALMSIDRMNSYKYSIIVDGKPIGTIKAVDIEMSNREFSDKEVLELFNGLHPNEFDENYTGAIGAIQRKLLRENSFDEMTSPKGRFTFELNENAPEPWKGVTNEHVGRLELEFIGLNKQTSDSVDEFYSENKRFRLKCRVVNDPTIEASVHFQKLLLGNKDFIEIEIAEDPRLDHGSTHLFALPHVNPNGGLFFRNISP